MLFPLVPLGVFTIVTNGCCAERSNCVFEPVSCPETINVRYSTLVFVRMPVAKL